MSKQLETLCYKALKTGHARKNGHMRYYGYIGELENQWEIEYNENNKELRLYHWGTLILHLGKSFIKGNIIVKDFYGQSKSDRDGICQICNLMGLPYYARYRPSLDQFEFTADFDTGEIITKVMQHGEILYNLN